MTNHCCLNGRHNVHPSHRSHPSHEELFKTSITLTRLKSIMADVLRRSMRNRAPVRYNMGEDEPDELAIAPPPPPLKKCKISTDNSHIKAEFDADFSMDIKAEPGNIKVEPGYIKSEPGYIKMEPGMMAAMEPPPFLDVSIKAEDVARKLKQSDGFTFARGNPHGTNYDLKQIDNGFTFPRGTPHGTIYELPGAAKANAKFNAMSGADGLETAKPKPKRKRKQGADDEPAEETPYAAKRRINKAKKAAMIVGHEQLRQ